jgi:hypothetical protein
VSWRAAAANRAIVTGYLVTWQSASGGSGTRIVSGTAHSTTVSGLTNGMTYTLSVAARNRIGDGPAAAADPVTPVAAASAPGLFTATINGTTAHLSWSAPNLNGGTLVHYLVGGTGLSSRSVTGTSTAVSGLAKGGSVTLTVRAVTRGPGGQTLTGAQASRTVRIPRSTITISRGPHNCDSSYPQQDCYRMHVVLTGFQPNTHYELQPHSDDPSYGNPGSGQDTDANGTVEFDAFEYFGTGHRVWVTTTTSSGTVESNHLLWGAW